MPAYRQRSLPAMVDPALGQMHAAVETHEGANFDAAFDALCGGGNACHSAAGHGFVVIQRPSALFLDIPRAAHASALSSPQFPAR